MQIVTSPSFEKKEIGPFPNWREFSLPETNVKDLFQANSSKASARHGYELRQD